MNPALLSNWESVYPSDFPSGLFLRFDDCVHEYIRDWLCEYARWLRKRFVFPVRVYVYCKYGVKVPCRYSPPAYGVILLPDSRSQYPNIRIACSKYARGEPVTDALDDETGFVMYTFTHEIMHYFQYINGQTGKSDRSLDWQASYYAKKILAAFFES